MDKAQIKRIWKKTWHFIWESDSWASWIVNIILAFVIIKFLVYPGLGLALGTSHPIVAVVSTSMEHDGSFENWWNSPAQCQAATCTQGEHYAELSISEADFKGFDLNNGFDKGDIMILKGTEADDLEIGDVIVFRSIRPDPIIHRIVKKTETENGIIYSTKGDHNPASFGFETYVTEDAYIGKAIVRIPLLGYLKIGFVKLIGLFA